MKKGKGHHTTIEISNLLSDFKQDIINDIATHLDTITTNKKHVEAEVQLVEYCPHYWKQKKDCQCKLVASMENQHLPTEYIKIDGDDEKVFFFVQCQPWAQCQGVPQDPLQNSNLYGNNWKNHNTQGPLQYSQPNWNNAWKNNPQQPQWPHNFQPSQTNQQNNQWQNQQNYWKNQQN